MICEDLEEERMALARMVRACCAARGVDLEMELTASGEELLYRFQSRRWDVIFLDIYMGGISGDQAARVIRASDRECALIFATTSREHGLLSYELQVTDYLLKPYSRKDVENALEWILQDREKQFQTITIRSDWVLEEIRVRDIQYIEILHHTAVLHLTDGIKQTRKGLQDLEREIGEGGSFLRCHRRYLVNLDYVTAIVQGDFKMKDGSLVPISTKRAAEMKRAFFDWSLEKTWGR